MVKDDSKTSADFYFKLISYPLVAAIILTFAFWLFGLSYQMFDKQAISAVSSFGAAASSILTIVLLVVYLRQTKVLEQHQNELEEQSELMGLTHLPEIRVRDRDIQDDDSIDFSLENRGEGFATNLKLITKVETPSVADIEDSLNGISDIYRINDRGEILDDQGLPPRTEGKFTSEPIIEKPLANGGSTPCSLRDIIQLVADDDGDWVRIDMKIQPHTRNGEESKPVGLFDHESSFRVDLSRIDPDSEQPFSLKNLRKCSTPI